MNNVRSSETVQVCTDVCRHRVISFDFEARLTIDKKSAGVAFRASSSFGFERRLKRGKINKFIESVNQSKLSLLIDANCCQPTSSSESV
jgi:hypothetical protein